MKFTIVFTTLLCVSTSWAVVSKDDPKDKREAPVSYGSSGLHTTVHGSSGHGSSGLQASAGPHSSSSLQGLSGISAHSYQPQSYQGDANAISIGAGYSIGGAKPSYSFGGQDASAALQEYNGQGLSPNGHATIQLAPITLQSPHGTFSAGDLSQIMSQLQHSLGGSVSLQPSNTVAEFHQTQGGDAGQGGQEYSFPQFTYGSPKGQQYSFSAEQLQSAPAYSSGSKGLGSYSTGPVLFTPSESQSAQPAAPSVSYGASSSGHNFGDAGSLSFGGAGHSLNGLNLGSLSGAGHLQSFSGPYKQLSSGYAPGKTSFKPSTFIGASVQGESGHGLSGLSGSYGAPSFSGFRGGPSGLSLSSAGHGGAGFASSLGFGSGSSKYLSPVYQSGKSEGLEGASAFSSGHVASPPGTTYGFPSSSYSPNTVHAASSNRPYFIPKQQSSSAYRSPVSSHGSVSSFSGPKYHFGSSSSHYSPKDAHGSASETVYNTIKYSEELKPHAH